MKWKHQIQSQVTSFDKFKKIINLRYNKYINNKPPLAQECNYTSLITSDILTFFVI